MSYTKVEVSALPAVAGSHPAASRFDKGVGVELGLRAFGVYQVELPAAAETVQHDHAADGAEDMYAFTAGTGSVVVDGERVPVSPGVFVAVTPDSQRHVCAGPDGLAFIAVCAAPPTAFRALSPPAGP